MINKVKFVKDPDAAYLEVDNDDVKFLPRKVGKFTTSDIDAQIEYDFRDYTDSVKLTIDQQYFNVTDLDDLTEFLAGARKEIVRKIAKKAKEA